MFEKIEKEAERYSREAERFSFFLYRTAIKDLEKLKIKGIWLEAGSGPGILAVKLSKKLGVEIEGIDNSAEMVEIANERARKFNAKVRFRVADVHERIEGSYDVVYSTFSLHHWKNPEIALENLWNALKPNGYLYVLDVRRNFIIKHGLDFRNFVRFFDRIRSVSKEFELRKCFPFLVTVKARK
ncbi:MAG: class I SAM-dependent methyltransferase [Archaeoglobus sp.]|nr:class I SAM-dependent methyltransferase [Archaeoglobus sp.]